MNTCLFKLTLIMAGAVLASQSLAQSRAPQGDAEAAKSSAATATVAANSPAKASTPVMRTVVAAGSVLLLVDGVVARAAIAQIHPPAPGFVYER